MSDQTRTDGVGSSPRAISLHTCSHIPTLTTRVNFVRRYLTERLSCGLLMASQPPCSTLTIDSMPGSDAKAQYTARDAPEGSRLIVYRSG